MKLFEVGETKCALYSQDGRLGADITEQGKDPEPLDVQMLFDYELDSLKNLLDEMEESECLNVRLEGQKLVFYRKTPEEPVELFAHMELQEIVIREAAVIASQQSYGQLLAQHQQAALSLLKKGGQLSVTVKRPKFVFDSNMQLQTSDSGSMKVDFKPREAIKQELAVLAAEEEKKAEIELKEEEEKKYALVKNEHQANARSKLDLESAKYAVDYKRQQANATARIQAQQLNNKKTVETLRATLEKEATNRKVEMEKELSRIQAALELQNSQIETVKNEMRIGVDRQVAQLRRESELAEKHAKQETERYSRMLEQDKAVTNQELAAIEQEKRDRARRKAEAERLARECAEVLPREIQRLEREAQARKQQRLAFLEVQLISYKQELCAAEQRRQEVERQLQWERQQAQQRQAYLQAQYEQQRRLEVEQSLESICFLL